MMKLKSYCSKTDQGPRLSVNEDDVDVDLINNLFLVFDGLGGAGIGDKAVRETKENLRRFYSRFGGDPNSTMPFFFGQRYLIEGNALINAFHYSHDQLKNKNATLDLSYKAAVSTLGLCLSDNIGTFVSTGNIASFLSRKGQFETLLAPDDAKWLSKDNYSPQWHCYPMSAIGLFDELSIQTKEIRLANDDLIVILTDGIHSRLKQEEIKSIVDKKHLLLKERAQELFDLANSRGNTDNQTALLLQF